MFLVPIRLTDFLSQTYWRQVALDRRRVSQIVDSISEMVDHQHMCVVSYREEEEEAYNYVTTTSHYDACYKPDVYNPDHNQNLAYSNSR